MSSGSLLPGIMGNLRTGILWKKMQNLKKRLLRSGEVAGKENHWAPFR